MHFKVKNLPSESTFFFFQVFTDLGKASTTHFKFTSFPRGEPIICKGASVFGSTEIMNYEIRF